MCASHSFLLSHVRMRLYPVALRQFLVNEKNFSEQRIRAAVGRIKAHKGKANQGRLDTFFSAVPKSNTDSAAAKPKGEIPQAMKA